MLYEIARPLVFAFDPEKAHHLSLRELARAHRLGLTRWLRPTLPDDPVEVFGLKFRNPVGLAAGLDKNAAYIDPLGDLGFGSIEVGTVTPRPQPGNPKPRMFRLPRARALINRLGFNNDGLARFVEGVGSSSAFVASGGVLGLNIGKNADTPLERALEDYTTCLREVYPLLVERPGYVTVNISSPNTRELRNLQGALHLDAFLRGLRDERRRLADRYGKRVPMALKIAPDLEAAELRRIADTVVECEGDAIIATNTTVARDGVAGQRNADQTGGLSGAPLLTRSTAVVAELVAHLQGRLPIIGVGGIMSGADARAKLAAGASLIQLYTGLVYRGPALVAECRRALNKRRA
ncbi:MAG TPA: quinone-dependent dihydroorotate dehydrogenase [Burkholderiaceae bacterium]|nr:quinone-dependent dihydroorotate dehydrogenase [Burkholderiaceae bacterium]